MIPVLTTCAAALALWFWVIPMPAPRATAGDVLALGAGGWTRSAVKTLSVALLALVALLAGGDAWLVAALSLGALGDFFLSRPSDRAFKAGVFAFLAGHLAYLGVFWPHLAGLQGNMQLLAHGVLIVVCLLMLRALWQPAAGMRLPITLYVAVSCALGLAAAALPWPHGGQVAAVMFIASDMLLAAGLFRLIRTESWRRYADRAVWPLYWGAQALFLASFAFQIPL